MRSWFAFLLCLVSVAWAQTPPPGAGQRTTIGIMPAYDGSGEAYGEIFTQNLTQMLFEEVQATGHQPVLLNPGGAYTPFDSDLIREFAEISKVDWVLVSTMQLPDKPRSGPYILKVEAHLVEAKTGSATPTHYYSESIRREQAIVEGGYIGMGAAWGFGGTGGSRRFEKQPLGKRARSFAKSIRTLVASALPKITPAAVTGSPSIAAGSCKVEFRVIYPRKNAISKSYGLVINGKEESLWIREGIASVTIPNGPALVLVNVGDAPYRLPIQRLYAANTFVECSAGGEAMSLDLAIGPAGEAFLQWK